MQINMIYINKNITQKIRVEEQTYFFKIFRFLYKGPFIISLYISIQHVSVLFVSNASIFAVCN